jgi:antitoxin ParD1/3/4
MQVSLTPKLEELIREKVESGLYHDASEVIRDALKIMQELDAVQGLKLERLREELAKGEADLAAGRKTTISNDDELSALFARL